MSGLLSVSHVYPPAQRGATVWLTGLPSAGKSTIAHSCEPALRSRGLRIEVLDGDAVRPHLAAARGYSREDRAINIRRIGWVAELLARNGVLVLVSAIAPSATCANRSAQRTRPTAPRTWRCTSARRSMWRRGAM